MVRRIFTYSGKKKLPASPQPPYKATYEGSGGDLHPHIGDPAPLIAPPAVTPLPRGRPPAGHVRPSHCSPACEVTSDCSLPDLPLSQIWLRPVVSTLVGTRSGGGHRGGPGVALLPDSARPRLLHQICPS